mmetsp:Transcript_44972/g.104004  ORF Transcript_44972/g.104004 Transcript_44972/m.104004 type:complete len:319 (+) Transcript_44972:1160-2116(+)
MFDHLPAFALNGVCVRRALERGKGVAQIFGLGVKPAWCLPAVGEAKLRTSSAQYIDDVLLRPLFVDHRPSTSPVLVEVGNDIVPPVCLLDLLPNPCWGGPLAVPRGVSLRQLIRRLTMLHPVHQVTRESGCMRYAVGLSAGVPVVRFFVRWSHKVVAVCWPAGWPIQDGLDARRLYRGDKARCCFHAVHKAVDVTLEEPIGQLRGHSSLPLGWSQLHDVFILVGAYENAIALIPEVIGTFQVSKDWQLVPMLLMIGLHFWHCLRDHILMLQDGCWCVYASKLANPLCPEPSAVDHAACSHNVGLGRACKHSDLPSAVR